MQDKETVNYLFLSCGQNEAIPLSVVRDCDAMDDGDPEVPPKFARNEACGGEMYPEFYKGAGKAEEASRGNGYGMEKRERPPLRACCYR